MIKLKEIIKSGGGNAKINRFINRYVLSKKEKNEIINEIKNIKGNGSSSGSSSKYAPRYYSIDWDKCSEDWNKMLNINIEDIDTLAFTIGATYKILPEDGYVIIRAYPNIATHSTKVTAFSMLSLRVKIPVFGNTFISNNLKESIIILNDFFKTYLGIDINLTMEGITEITEEEYYKID